MIDYQELLNTPLPDNDAYAETIRTYLKKLLILVWIEEEGFDGKRPFGNSGWQWEVVEVVQNKYPDQDANELILGAIEYL